MNFRIAKTTWIKSSLAVFAAGFFCVQSRGATNVASNFETPPPKPGSIQWDKIHNSAKEQQELYRKRFSISNAMAADVPRAYGANFLPVRQIPQTPARAPSEISGFFFKALFFAIVIFTIGILAIRKFAPQVLAGLNQRLNPWTIAPADKNQIPASVRAEEEAFTKFLATFRIGPATPKYEAFDNTGSSFKEFYNRAEKFIAKQRTLLQEIIREAGIPVRQKKLAALLSEMSSLKGEAGFPQALPAWQVASALEGLLKQLADQTGNVTQSTLRVVAGGIDLLENLCVPGLKPDLLTHQPLKFLVVDDDLISRQAISLALKKAFSQPDIALDGETALVQAGQAYDVIFLDVQMPGMDGFELCKKIHETNVNRATPIVFVTVENDFDARAKSVLSGGNDLMAKPFLTFEITVKALTLALQNRLQKEIQSSPQQNADRVNSSIIFMDALRSNAEFANVVRPQFDRAQTNDFTNSFLSRASAQFGPLQNLCQEILATVNEEARQNMLADVFLRVNSLIPPREAHVTHPAVQTCVVLEGLLKKMLQDSKNSTPSAVSTMIDAVDLLQELCRPGLKTDLATNPPIQMLVVDDDLVARRVIAGALQTVFARPESVESGETALALAAEKVFDVIFLDIQMPGMDGFEVCSKIRETILNRNTPIIFVTGHADFQTHARINRSGNNLLQKPFLTAEITTKALTFALRGRLEKICSKDNLPSANGTHQTAIRNNSEAN